jgi:Immunity protein 27
MSGLDKYLRADETNLNGAWVTVGGQMIADATCRQIEWLTKHYVRKITDSSRPEGWETAYQDPKDGRYWEKTYPQSEMHGGGPPRPHVLTTDEYSRRYGDR